MLVLPLISSNAIQLHGVNPSYPDIGSSVGFSPNLFVWGGRDTILTGVSNPIDAIPGNHLLTSFSGSFLNDQVYAACKWTGALLTPHFESNFDNEGNFAYYANKIVYWENRFNAGIAGLGLNSARFVWFNAPQNALTIDVALAGTYEIANSVVSTIVDAGFWWTQFSPKFSDTQVALFTYGQDINTFNIYAFAFDGAAINGYNIAQLPLLATDGFQAIATDFKYKNSYQLMAFANAFGGINRYFFADFTPQAYSDGTGAFVNTITEFQFDDAALNSLKPQLGIIQIITAPDDDFYAFYTQTPLQLVIIPRDKSGYKLYPIVAADNLAQIIKDNYIASAPSNGPGLYSIIYNPATKNFIFTSAYNQDTATGSSFPIYYGIMQLDGSSKIMPFPITLNCADYCIPLLEQK